MVGVFDGVIDIDGAFMSTNIVADFICSFVTTGALVIGVAEGPVVRRGYCPAT